MDYREGKKLADEAREITLKFQNQDRLSKEEEGQMVTAAQAAVFIWTRVGTPLQVARAHWLAARAFCILMEPKFASLHAQLCDFFTKQAGDRKDFDDAYAMEILARTALLRGDMEGAKRLLQEAQALGQKIRDPQEKVEFEKKLRALSWSPLEVAG
jgi:hypothetical protein